MAIRFRAAGPIATGNFVTSITLAAPPGTVATDVVLAVLIFGGGPPVITPPAGWNLVNQVPSPHFAVAVYWGLGSATFGAWTGSFSSAVMGWTLGYIGVDNTTPMDVAAVGRYDVGPTITTPPLTPITSGSWLVAFGGWYSSIPSPLPTFSAQSLDTVATTDRQNGGFAGAIDVVALDTFDAAWTTGAMSGSVNVSINNENIGILVAPRPLVSTHFGVDSITHADLLITDPDSPTRQVRFFDFVTRRAGTPPEFWCRYIGSQRDGDNLYPAEADYLAGKNCKILLVYNGPYATSATVRQPGPTGRQNGVNAAQDAINFITTVAGLQVPGGKTVAIYCAIDQGWSPTKEFFGGWFDTMASSASPYVGAVYGDTAVLQFNTPFCDAYAANPASMQTALVWTFQPNISPCDFVAAHAPAFGPTPPPCPPPSVAYQYSINCNLGGTPTPPQIDVDLANDQGFASMWDSSHLIYAVWIGFRPLTPGNMRNVFVLSASMDGGTTWSTPVNSPPGDNDYAFIGSLPEPSNDIAWVPRGAKVNVYYVSGPGGPTPPGYIRRITFDPASGWVGPFTQWGLVNTNMTAMVGFRDNRFSAAALCWSDGTGSLGAGWRSNVSYVDLSSGTGDFLNPPIQLVTGRNVAPAPIGYYDVNGNPVVSWIEGDASGNRIGHRMTRVGTTWTETQFSNTSDPALYDNQRYLLPAPPYNMGYFSTPQLTPIAMTNEFRAWARASSTSTSLLHVFRKKDQNVASASDTPLDLRAIAEPPDPNIAQSYLDSSLGMWERDNTVLGFLVTSRGPNPPGPDLWAVLGRSDGTDWHVKRIFTENAVSGQGGYVKAPGRAIDWEKR